MILSTVLEVVAGVLARPCHGLRGPRIFDWHRWHEDASSPRMLVPLLVCGPTNGASGRLDDPGQEMQPLLGTLRSHQHRDAHSSRHTDEHRSHAKARRRVGGVPRKLHLEMVALSLLGLSGSCWPELPRIHRDADRIEGMIKGSSQALEIRSEGQSDGEERKGVLVLVIGGSDLVSAPTSCRCFAAFPGVRRRHRPHDRRGADARECHHPRCDCPRESSAQLRDRHRRRGALPWRKRTPADVARNQPLS